jgi:hypothetical protein
VDSRDIGNLESRLVRSFSRSAAIERCQSGLDRLMDLLLHEARERVEVLATSPTHVGLLLHGLEFARVHHGVGAHSFTRENEITFGAGANETPLTEARVRKLRSAGPCFDHSPRRNPVLKIEIQLITTTKTQPMRPVKKAPSRKRITQTAIFISQLETILNRKYTLGD